MVQSLAGQPLPSHIPLVKIGGQAGVVAGVPLQGCRRRFRGVLAAGRAHRRGSGGLIARTGCRGRVRALGFVHLKARGKDGSEPGAALRQVGMLCAHGGVSGSPARRRAGHSEHHAVPLQLPTTSQHGGAAATAQAAFTQLSGVQSPTNQAALAPAAAAAQKETTPFPRAVLQPWPKH